MSNLSDDNTVYQDEPIDIFELWGIIWQEKLIVIAVTSAFAIGSVFYALAQIDIYRSTALLVPAESSQPQSPLLAQLGQAAGLVGIGSSDGTTNKITTAVAMMQSREFARQFINKYQLKPILFASQWNAELLQSEFDRSIFDELSNQWVDPEPSDQMAIQLFQAHLSVSRNLTTNMVTVAFEWPDPYLAEKWVSLYVQEINAQIKAQDLREATNAIEYLQSQLQSTQLVEMQRAFYQLIESQTRVVMLADARDDYVFRVVDPAYVPEQPSRPSRSTICIVGTLLGGFFSLFIVGLLHIYRQRKEQHRN